MPKRELEALADPMEEMFDELMKGSPRLAVLQETERAAELS